MREVKGYRFIFLIISVLILLGMVFVYDHSKLLSISVNEDGSLLLQSENEWEDVKAWEREGIHYFFMPSYMEDTYIGCENGSVQLNGLPNMDNKIRIPWNETSDLVLKDTTGADAWQGQVCFMKSQNIPALHISVEDVETLNLDKGLKMPAEMTLVDSNGSVNYQGPLEYITGRGNTTWALEKKTYTIKLTQSYPLLGMDSSKKWVLLANGYEGSKIMYKMTMDIASQMGMDYVPQMTWVDLYVNGTYQGNYLLSEKIRAKEESVDIEDLNTPNELASGDMIADTFVDGYFKGYETDKNPGNITGGYLIEKDFPSYYSEETCGFITNRLYTFSIKHPSMATRAEAEYIWGFVTAIDNLMAAGDEAVLQFIDKKSFIQKYILDEVSLSSDSNITSAYFYKKRDENILYAGPPWDYDGVYGESGGVWHDYTQTVLDVNPLRNTEGLALDWYNVLYSFDSCKHDIIEEYKRVLPIYEYYLQEGIDSYQDTIYDSVQMDMIRWDYGKNQAGYYDNYDNTIKYLKYFLANRLNWLNQRWGIDIVYELPEVSEAMHNVYVHVDGEVHTLQIRDGQCVEAGELPMLTDEYIGYVYQRDNREFSSYLPVYEEQVIEAIRNE